MIDKLIVSDEQGADFKGRSRYFVVSTVVVGILFISAVVFSLYAADIGLGNDQFELSMMLAPVTPEAPEPPKPLQAQPRARTSDVPIRNTEILRILENPKAPAEISVTPANSLSRPEDGRFKIGPGSETGLGPGNDGTPGGEPVGTSAAMTSEPVSTVESRPDPPPAIPPKPPVRTTVSEGVINGKATFLPPPPYPPNARLVNAQGAVNVQVTIDESGKVISSKAISGHPLLKGAAEKAAWNARFSPTFLSRVPVKVTGVIVYNFKRS